MTESTHIRVRDETADRLYARKERGESYDDVVSDLLDRTEKESSDEHETERKETEA